MRENNRKSRTEAAQKIDIPMLKIPQMILQDSPIRYKPTKEPLNFLKVAPLDHNQQFLKEKSLYRYTISRKLSRNSNNKSQTCLLQNASLKHNKSEINIESSVGQPPQVDNKQRSVYSNSSNGGGPQQRYFRRRSQNNTFQDLSSKTPNQEGLESVMKQERQNQRQKPRFEKENCHNCEKDTKSYRIENNQLKRQIMLLKEEKTKLNKQVEQKNKIMDKLHDDNDKLLKEFKKIHPIHSDRFIVECKLENELLVRGHFINELLQKIKYLQLQNSILKKAKKDKEQQAGIIYKLQKNTRQLESKLKILTALRTKRNKLKGSMMSSCSEISLNLSVDADDDEMGKFYDALKTTERTQERTGFLDTGFSISQKQMEDQPCMLPLWQPKLTM